MYAARKYRALPVLAGTMAAVVFSAAPAFAGSDGDDEIPVAPPPPAATAPVTPAPVQPAPVQPAPVTAAPLQGESGGSGGSRGSVRSGQEHGSSAPKTATRRTPSRQVNTRRVATQLTTQTTPQGGVQAGAGGMAEQGPDALLLGLASGALVLIAAGGGLGARGRRGVS